MSEYGEVEISRDLITQGFVAGLFAWNGDDKCWETTELGNQVILDYCQKIEKEAK